MTKDCPIYRHGYYANPANINSINLVCKEEKCAWWLSEHKCCAIALKLSKIFSVEVK